jgi:quercetin dioxygenase-like cupin family protein
MGVIHKFKGQHGGFAWDGVAITKYPNEGARDVIKMQIIGLEDGAKNFEMRYFEVGPGGYTSFDNHIHDHGVLVLRGRGMVRLGKEKYDIGFGDVIYIAPNEDHQFENNCDEPLGFICVIPPKKKG